MKKVLITITLLLYFIIPACAQNEQNIWVINYQAGLDFNTPLLLPTVVSNNFLAPLQGGNATICDANGNLLFYTSGFWVWDNSNEIMPGLTNGITGVNYPNPLGYPPLMPWTGGMATQKAVITNVPAHAGRYYIFSLGDNGELFYSIIDMSLNNGKGDIVNNKKGIFLSSGLAGKMTVIKGCDNIWLIVRSKQGNKYLSYEIVDTGIVLTPVVSNVGSMPVDWYSEGVIKFSPDGSRMAAACNRGNQNAGGLELYDFDYRTGLLSNPVVLDSSSSNGYYYGACFSPDNTKLYATTSSYGGPLPSHHGQVHQFDLSSSNAANIIASNTILYTDPYNQSGYFGDLKRGPDGKIYIGGGNPVGVAYMHVIQQPNLPGAACNFTPNAIIMTSVSWDEMLNLPNDIALLNVPDTVRRTKILSICFKDSVVLAAKAGKWYRWQDNSNLQSLTVHDNGIYVAGYVNTDCQYEIDSFKVNFVHVPKMSPNSYSCNGKKQGVAWAAPVNGDTARFTYNWKDANGTVLQMHTVRGADTIKGLDSGLYHVALHTAGGCDTDLEVRILPIPSPQATVYVDSIVCSGIADSFYATTDAPAATWYFGDGSNSSSLDPIHIYPQSGGYDAAFIVSNLEGCSDTIQQHIEVKRFQISLSADQDIVNIGERVLLQSGSDQPYTVTAWEPAALFINQAAKDQSLIMDSTLQFLVAGQSPDGCIDTATIKVSVNPVVFMPSAFSPNGDGLNDYFRPRTAGASIYVADFEIYNRWGQVVWSSYGSEAAKGWDGRFHGVNADAGVYFYTIHIITPEEGIIDLRGDVTLVR